MQYYFRTRHTAVVVIVAGVLEALLILVARPFTVRPGADVIGFGASVPLQILVVASLTLGLSGRTEQFEFGGVRPLRLLRLLNVSLLFCAGLLLSFLHSEVSAQFGQDPGTVGRYAAVRAFIGLFGVAVGVIAFTDMRLAALCAVPLISLPAVIDAEALPGGRMLGFVLADDTSQIAWGTAIGAWIIGAALYVLCYSERNSPSANRRHLLAARRSRRRG